MVSVEISFYFQRHVEIPGYKMVEYIIHVMGPMLRKHWFCSIVTTHTFCPGLVQVYVNLMALGVHHLQCALVIYLSFETFVQIKYFDTNDKYMNQNDLTTIQVIHINFWFKHQSCNYSFKVGIFSSKGK